MIVGEELDIPYLQNHMKSEFLACLFQNGDCAILSLGKRRNKTGIGETG
jgi:hypothetical protein